ncbi:hypothetical protein DSO57_1018424 [Entomophthora muscae]|uniref:Uncharacterized protein n=1 Tax=Entomophthora muscae TaxID=34485 RepID=A0ACC2TFD9_9FUNG|nr:hypothetical protein DSO57_1018424 [Entomophthora muscae]
MAKNLKEIHARVKENMTQAMSTYKAYTDQKRREGPMYQPGDLVMIDSWNMRLKILCHKLGPKRTFHKCLLTKNDGPMATSHVPLLMEDEPEYNLKAMIASRLLWKENSWISHQDPNNADELVQAFHHKSPQAVGPTGPQLAAMKLTLSHKNLALSAVEGGGVSPLTRVEGNVMDKDILVTIVCPKKAQQKEAASRKVPIKT